MNRNTIVPLLALLGLAAPFLLAGCGQSKKPGLLLAGAFFKADYSPVPAQLLIARPQGADEPWSLEILEAEDGSNVFHKALVFTPASGPAGILTISGSKAPDPAFLKFWRKSGDGWEAETIYQGKYGGAFDRCRDMEVADVTGDGVDEILVVTHQRGVVVVVEQKDGKFVPKEIASTVESGEEVWIHEVEVGDVDGDGINEFFATPSAPNTLDGKEQPGKIVMYDYDGGEFKETVVETLTSRHVKEILVHDIDGSGTPTLFAAVEGESIGGEGGKGAAAEIRSYRREGDKFVGEVIIDLPGKLTRFLSGADTDGDGNKEIVVSTSKHGIFVVSREGDGWKKRSVAPGSISSGFEHCSKPLDWDGDGKDDIFVLSDNDKLLRRFYYDEESSRYRSQKILEFKDFGSMLIFNMEVLPAGM